MTAKLYDIKEICQRLNASAATLAPELVPNLKRDGGQLRAGDLEGGEGRSLCVTVKAPYQGMWRDFGTDDRGDMLDLIARTRTGGDKGAALKWATSWLQMDHETPRPAAAPRAGEAETHKNEGRRRAEMLWWNGQPYAGSMAEEYDRGRGLFWHDTLGAYPQCVRFHPAVPCVEVGRALPAMLLHITGARGEHAAVQILWLERRHGMVTKAALAAPKKVWGSYKGNAIEVWRGPKQTPLGEAEEGDLVMIGEGYEDAATAALSRPEHRALAAVGLSNMGHLFLPRQVKTVRLLMQNDPLEHPTRPGVPHPAQMMLYAAIRVHQYAGRVVELSRPPPGVKDLNDLARRDRQ